MTSEGRATPFWSDEEIEAALGNAISHLKDHGVLAYPTETVYGFGGAVDTESVNRLIALKGRPPNKPFLLIVAASEMIGRLDLRLRSYGSQRAARFWQPLTLVLPRRRAFYKLRGRGRIAVRWTPPAASAVSCGLREPRLPGASRPGVEAPRTRRDQSSGASRSFAVRCTVRYVVSTASPRHGS